MSQGDVSRGLQNGLNVRFRLGSFFRPNKVLSTGKGCVQHIVLSSGRPILTFAASKMGWNHAVDPAKIKVAGQNHKMMDFY
jgi:hypothetical protein